MRQLNDDGSVLSASPAPVTPEPGEEEVAVPLDEKPGIVQLLGQITQARVEVAAWQGRVDELEGRLREAIGAPGRPGQTRTATYGGRVVARWTAYTERRISTRALRESFPDVATAVTDDRTRTRFTLEGTTS